MVLTSFSALSEERVGPFNIRDIEVHSSGIYFVQRTPIVTSIPCNNYISVKYAPDTKVSDRVFLSEWRHQWVIEK